MDQTEKNYLEFKRMVGELKKEDRTLSGVEQWALIRLAFTLDATIEIYAIFGNTRLQFMRNGEILEKEEI